MKLGFVAITDRLLVVQYENDFEWFQTYIPHHYMIMFMWEHFPDIMKQSPIIYNERDLANWLYEYGGYDNGVIYIFNDHNSETTFDPMSFRKTRINPPKYISYNLCKTAVLKERDPE